MSDSTINLEQIETAQAAKEATANQLFDAASPATIFGRHAEECAGLTFGYYGGRYGGVAVPNGGQLLTASTVTYMVVDRITSAVSFDTATTDWADTANFARAYLITTGADSVTGYEDHRAGTNGTQAGGGEGGSGVTIDPDPNLSANSDAAAASQKATKTYVDSRVAGIAYKGAVAAATVTALPANTYSNGASGVGATLTGNSNGALSAQDGVTLALNDALLVKNEAAGERNGRYVLTQVGSGGAPYILTRATDADTGAELLNATMLVTGGSQIKQQWNCNAPSTIVVGTTPLTFAKINVASGDASTNTTSSVDGEAALFSGTDGKTLKRATGSGYPKLTSGVQSVLTALQLASDVQGNGLTDKQAGFRNIPQNIQSGDYTTVATDSGGEVFHPFSATASCVWTIAANASVPYPLGTAITFCNQRGAGNVTITIAGTDIMNLAGSSAGVGPRTLAPNGWATAKKITATEWIISGAGLI